MSKTSTIHFTINDLASESKGEIINIDECFNRLNKDEDVIKVLEMLDYDVPQEIVNSILEYASAKK